MKPYFLSVFGARNLKGLFMAEWVIPANTSDYDVIAAFQKLDKIEWHEARNAKIKAGDIVYIYVSNTAELKYKCKVNKTGITRQNLKIDDKRFYRSQKLVDKNTSDESLTFMELELLEELDGSMYKRQELLQFGFPNNMQHRQKVSDVLHEHLESIKMKYIPKIDCKDNDFIWLSAALLSYKMYNDNKEVRWPFYYFRQCEIVNCAKEFFNKIIDDARCSQWTNADHANKSKNYLRGTLPEISPERSGNFPFRRLTRFDEFPKNTYPSNIDPEIQISGIKIADLFDFVKNDYPKVFKTDIDYISILNHIKKNSNKDYQKPEKCENENDARRFSKLKEKSKYACSEFNKIPELLCNSKIIDLDTYQKSGWTDGSNTKVRDYLWVRMRNKKYENDPTSISIFAQIDQKDPQTPCFRVSLETEDNSNDSPEKWEHYHSHLKLPITNSELVYVSGSNCEHKLIIEGQDSNVVRQKLENGDISKIQICKYIRQKSDQTNEYFEYEIAQAVRDLMPYYDYVVSNSQSKMKTKINDDFSTNLNNDSIKNAANYPKNLILYGPPGTGKTYNSIIYAVAICEKEKATLEDIKTEKYPDVIARYKDYVKKGRIAFTTFHQSYGYEEFIEGIKPKMSEDNNSLSYEIKNGVFKDFCIRAARGTLNSDEFTIDDTTTIWGIYLGGSGNTGVKNECFNEGEIRLGFNEFKDEDIDNSEVYSPSKYMVSLFRDSMKIGDVILVAENTKHIDAIGIIDGEYEYNQEKNDYARVRKVRWLVKGISYDITGMLPPGRKQMPRNTLFSFNYLGTENVLKILSQTSEYIKYDNSPRVFIIDEINRGNISKIFGELITLIEPTKRQGEPEGMETILPYSNRPFSVPNNVYLLGTMNTADRSITQMDTALRRRFQFEEMLPDPTVLAGIKIEDKDLTLNVAEMLEKMNKRIEFLYDREHTIGHAFFTGLRDTPSITKLAEVFKKSVIPLLQEYFYDDYQKIMLVLGDNGKDNDDQKFIKIKGEKLSDIFKGNIGNIDLPECTYEINNNAFGDIESYIKI